MLKIAIKINLVMLALLIASGAIYVLTGFHGEGPFVGLVLYKLVHFGAGMHLYKLAREWRAT